MTENANAAEAPRSSNEGVTEAGNSGRNRFGYRGSNRRNNRGRRNNNGFKTCESTSRFEGSEPTLKGHIYDFTSERNPDQFIKTTRQIKLYVGRTFTKYPREFTQAIDELYLEEPQAPIRPENAGNVFAMEGWEIDVREH